MYFIYLFYLSLFYLFSFRMGIPAFYQVRPGAQELCVGRFCEQIGGSRRSLAAQCCRDLPLKQTQYLFYW